ncbi:hypothetical protein V8F20_004764 [Naviculisporaceae sp. PSN 640]
MNSPDTPQSRIPAPKGRTTVPRPQDRRLPPSPPAAKREQQQQRGSAQATNSNTANTPQGRTASILKLIPNPNQQQTQPNSSKLHTPPARGYRRPAPADIENWLDSARDQRHDHTRVTFFDPTPLLDQPVTQNRERKPSHSHASGTISPLDLDQSSSHRLSSAPLGSSPFHSSPPTTNVNSKSGIMNLPQTQPPLTGQLAKLQSAVKFSREAETLHAYDVGVIAALRSMVVYWNSRATARQTSSSEKRIFLREAQRLTEFLDGAERDMLISNAELVNKQERENELWQVVLADSQHDSVVSPPVETGWEVVDGKNKVKGARNGHSAVPVYVSENANAKIVESRNYLLARKEKGRTVGGGKDEKNHHTERVPSYTSFGFVDESVPLYDDSESISDFEDLDSPGSRKSLESQSSWLDE